MIDVDKENKISKANKKLTCELVTEIIYPLYKKLGYKLDKIHESLNYK